MEDLHIAGHTIKAGESRKLDLPTPPLYTDTSMSIPIYVTRGKKPGPTLFVSAAIHGDELNGIEIISRLIHSKAIKGIKGTLIAIPFVNGYGILNQSRYLPDRRDLNRSFPGSKRGSLAGRIAHTFLHEIVSKCDYGIDLHTGAIHRSNLPQVRANLDDEKTLELARAFGVPVLLNANLRDGSLRQCASEFGARVLLYEAGEALRFDELSIRAGYRGVLNIMRALGMIRQVRRKTRMAEPFVARQSGWVRAPESGFVTHLMDLGARVKKGDLLASIKDHFGDIAEQVLSPADGIVIGKQNIPLAQEGEAMYHIAYFSHPGEVAENVEIMQENLIANEQLGPML